MAMTTENDEGVSNNKGFNHLLNFITRIIHLNRILLRQHKSLSGQLQFSRAFYYDSSALFGARKT